MSGPAWLLAGSGSMRVCSMKDHNQRVGGADVALGVNIGFAICGYFPLLMVEDFSL